jgi:hypothetical protein
MPTAVATLEADDIVGPAIDSGQMYNAVGGSGAVLQAAVLPLGFVLSACRKLAAIGDELTEHHLIEVAVGNLRKLRSGIIGDGYDGLMLTAFRGVTLSTDVVIETPWGRLIHADRMSSEMWRPDHPSAVLVTTIHSFLRPSGSDPSDHTEHFGSESRELSDQTQRNGQLVSYGLALGSLIDDPATAVPFSSGELLPISMVGRGGPHRSIGFHNRSAPIGGDEATEIMRWMTRLDSAPLDRIDVALRRLVRGLAERVDYFDSLIDAVIGWENLVEHRDQPTKSVLDGISVLVGDSVWSKSRITKVYETRSNLIHGEPPDYGHSKDITTDALRIGLDALRSLFDNHPDKLEMTSEERVEALGFVARKAQG